MIFDKWLFVVKFLLVIPFAIAIIGGIGDNINKLKFITKVWLVIVLTVYICVVITIWS